MISGGYLLTGAEANVFYDRRSGNGWTVGVDNTAAGDPATGSPTAPYTIDVQCAATGNTAVSSSARRTVVETADWWNSGGQRTGVLHRPR